MRRGRRPRSGSCMSVTSIAYTRWPVGCSECVGPLKEVVKVAFEFAWSHRAANGADRGSVRAWLLGITHEKAVDVLRGLDSAGDPSQEPADLAESVVAADEFVSTRAGNREDAPALLDALAGVPPEQSRVIGACLLSAATTNRRSPRCLKCRPTS